jgi:hypothetical protein
MLRSALASARPPLRRKLCPRSASQRKFEDSIIAYSLTSFRKTFSTTSAWHTINSLHTFSEEEDLLRESGKLPIGLLSRAAHGIVI